MDSATGFSARASGAASAAASAAASPAASSGASPGAGAPALRFVFLPFFAFFALGGGTSHAHSGMND